MIVSDVFKSGGIYSFENVEFILSEIFLRLGHEERQNLRLR